jgi:hypothetical protein
MYRNAGQESSSIKTSWMPKAIWDGNIKINLKYGSIEVAQNYVQWWN